MSRLKVAFFLLALVVQPFAHAQPILGLWQGKLTIPGTTLRIVVEIKSSGGVLSATMQSPDQTPQPFQADAVSFLNNQLKLEFKAIQGVYTGILSADEKTLKGDWVQGGVSLPLDLSKVDKIQPPDPKPPVVRPQEPKPPFPYKILEVSFENKAAKAVFSGTLTLPAGVANPPVVVMVTGSGAQDRDESIMDHKPFWVIADYLSRRGIAVLRFDDRGFGKSTGDRMTATTLDFADDALAAVAFLKGRKDINPKQIGIIGHSEGGLICAISAAKSKDVAFVVSMAGTGVDGAQIVLEQTERISRASGVPEPTIKRQSELQKKLFDVLTDEIPDDEAKKRAGEVASKAYDDLTSEEKAAAGSRESFVAQMIGAATSRWFRIFLALDPSEFWSKVKVPALILNGEKDLQVLADQNLPSIEKSLKAAGNKRFEVQRLPGLNHLFQTANTGLPSEYSGISETISPNVLKIIADWILKTTK